VLVQGVPGTRESVSSVRELLIDRPGGGHVRLEQVADVSIQPAPTAIRRDAVSRYVDVEAEVSGPSLGAVAGDVEDRLANVKFPLEYHAEVLQESTSQEANVTRIVGFGIAVAIAIFFLLQAAFRSWRLAALAFLTLPVALVGGVLAALIDGAMLSLGALIAFLALLGIAARNGVLLIHHFQRLQVEKAQAFGAELVQRGARDRLAPVLTTALALALLLLPFVIMGDVAGLEIVHPMAIVMLGGLITSTLLSLFMLPALYLRFGTGEPIAETPRPPSVSAGLMDDNRKVAAEPDDHRRLERAPARQADAAHQEQPAEAGSTPPTQEGGQDTSPRRGNE
jgi:Cu/Ag efflux pump CusA